MNSLYHHGKSHLLLYQTRSFRPSVHSTSACSVHPCDSVPALAHIETKDRAFAPQRDQKPWAAFFCSQAPATLDPQIDVRAEFIETDDFALESSLARERFPEMRLTHRSKRIPVVIDRQWFESSPIWRVFGGCNRTKARFLAHASSLAGRSRQNAPARVLPNIAPRPSVCVARGLER